MNSLCEACGGLCCSFKTMRVVFAKIEEGETLQHLLDRHYPQQLLRPDGKPAAKMRFYDAREKESEERCLLFECGHLSPQGKCRIYANRPEMCRTFECEALKGEMKLGPMILDSLPYKWRSKRDVTRQVHETARKAGAGR